MQIDLNTLKFASPFSMIIAGPSGSGKTHFVRKLFKFHKSLLHPMCEKLRVLWVYGIWQKEFKQPIENVDIDYVDVLPSEDEIKERNIHMIVVDDLMNEMSDDNRIGNLFTRASHHLNIDVIFIVQNLFHQGKQMRNLHLNAHYLVLLKNNRDPLQIDILGRQLKMLKALSEAYKDATKKPFGYLILDFKQATPRDFMTRTRIFPDESANKFTPIIYIPK